MRLAEESKVPRETLRLLPRTVIPSAAEGSPLQAGKRWVFDDEKREVLSLPPRTPVVISGVQERFLGFARNDDTGKATFSYLPPSSGRRCPEGAEARSCHQLKKNVRYAFPRIVIPSAAEGSFSFPVSLFLRNAVCMKHRDPTSQRVRCFPLSAVLTPPDRSRMKKISRFHSK